MGSTPGDFLAFCPWLHPGAMHFPLHIIHGSQACRTYLFTSFSCGKHSPWFYCLAWAAHSHSRCPHSLTLCDVPAADISTVIVDKPQKAALLLEHVERKETPGLKLIILMEPFEEALKDRGQECGVVVKSMQAVEVRVCFRVGGLLGRSKLATEPELLLICPFYGSGWMSWAIRVCQG